MWRGPSSISAAESIFLKYSSSFPNDLMNDNLKIAHLSPSERRLIEFEGTFNWILKQNTKDTFAIQVKYETYFRIRPVKLVTNGLILGIHFLFILIYGLIVISACFKLTWVTNHHGYNHLPEARMNTKEKAAADIMPVAAFLEVLSFQAMQQVDLYGIPAAYIAGITYERLSLPGYHSSWHLSGSSLRTADSWSRRWQLRRQGPWG